MNNILHPTIPSFEDDGFSITATEPWFKVKVQVIMNYFQAFVASAASRADEIIFVDLFSGNGLYSMGHQKEIFAGSALTALTLDLPVSQYIFCEADSHEARVLRSRIRRYFPGQNVTVFNTSQKEIAARLKILFSQQKGKRFAVFCLVDAFSLNIPFSLVEELAETGCSLVIPFTFHLNGRRDSAYYLSEQHARLKHYAGPQIELLDGERDNICFYKRLVKIYQRNMLMLGLNTALTVHKLNSQLMELPMYYIGYFSKQISPKAISRDVHAAEQLQFALF